MPLKSYAVLKCRPIGERDGSIKSPHYQIHVADQNNHHFRIAVNIKSQTKPPDLLYCVCDDFRHSITRKLQDLDFGITPLESKAGGIALDYIRGNLFDYRKMQVLPCDLPGADNDLNEMIDKYVYWALKMKDAEIYAFGETWGPENKPDPYFNFKPAQGIHDIHMNQGNSGVWTQDNGTWQDGGILFHFPAINKWIAIFFAFQSQSFHTDDQTGNPIQVPDAGEGEDFSVRIAAALVNVSNNGHKKITLVNTTHREIDLTNWSIADTLKNKHKLQGKIRPGEFLTVSLADNYAKLSINGGIITLLNHKGLKVDGVSYTSKDCLKPGHTILF